MLYCIRGLLAQPFVGVRIVLGCCTCGVLAQLLLGYGLYWEGACTTTCSVCVVWPKLQMPRLIMQVMVGAFPISIDAAVEVGGRMVAVLVSVDSQTCALLLPVSVSILTDFSPWQTGRSSPSHLLDSNIHVIHSIP